MTQAAINSGQNTPPAVPPAPSPSQANTTTAGIQQSLNIQAPAVSGTLTATGLLLAFLVGFYALVGRERKSPYLTNQLFQILLPCVAAVILSLLGQLFTTVITLAWLAAACLVLALIMTFWRVYKIYMRFAWFVDSAHIKHWSWYRKIKHFFRQGRKPWEWDGIALPKDLQEKIQKILSPQEIPAPSNNSSSSPSPASAAISVPRHGEANRILAELAIAFLEQGRLVQYMTASRHPLEFIKYLQDRVKEKGLEWGEIKSKIVVADAYTGHFGYADSIYMRATTELIRTYGVQQVTAGESFAGLHTASSRAFNKIKTHAKKGEGRQAMLVIYEDSYALADLESREQYRIFVRHVVPSEKMWQGMFTVFIETAQEASDWKLLSSYCDLSVEVKSEDAK